MKLQNELPKMKAAFNRLNDTTSIQDYVDSLKISGGYNDLKTRASWVVFWGCLDRGYLGDNYLQFLDANYQSNDSHIDTLIKKAMDEIGIKF
jgi:hypothetical protein